MLMFSEAYTTYLVHRKQWLRDHWDEYVVILANDVAGFFPTFAEAFEAGHRRYGAGVFFLVMRVHESDQLAAVY
jgi:hypothetical protein